MEITHVHDLPKINNLLEKLNKVLDPNNQSTLRGNFINLYETINSPLFLQLLNVQNSLEHLSEHSKKFQNLQPNDFDINPYSGELELFTDVSKNSEIDPFFSRVNNFEKNSNDKNITFSEKIGFDVNSKFFKSNFENRKEFDNKFSSEKDRNYIKEIDIKNQNSDPSYKNPKTNLNYNNDKFNEQQVYLNKHKKNTSDSYRNFLQTVKPGNMDDIKFVEELNKLADGRPLQLFVLNKEGRSSLGFRLVKKKKNEERGVKEGIYISHIEPNGAADRDQGLKVGDMLLSINHNIIDPTIAFDFDRIIDKIPTTNGVFEIITAKSSLDEKSRNNNLDTEGLLRIEVVDLVNDGTGLGFGIIKRLPNGVNVKTILENGVAYRDGRMKRGDHILQVGDIVVKNMTTSEVASILRKSGVNVRLVVGREPSNIINQSTSEKIVIPTSQVDEKLKFLYNYNPEALDNNRFGNNSPEQSAKTHHKKLNIPNDQSTSLPYIYDVEVTKDDTGLGMTVTGYSHSDGKSMVVVNGISKERIIGRDGRIAIGDEIIQVDDYSLTNVTNMEAVQILQNTGKSVKLKLLRNSVSQINEENYDHNSNQLNARDYEDNNSTNKNPILRSNINQNISFDMDRNFSQYNNPELFQEHNQSYGHFQDEQHDSNPNDESNKNFTVLPLSSETSHNQSDSAYIFYNQNQQVKDNIMKNNLEKVHDSDKSNVNGVDKFAASNFNVGSNDNLAGEMNCEAEFVDYMNKERKRARDNPEVLLLSFRSRTKYEALNNINPTKAMLPLMMKKEKEIFDERKKKDLVDYWKDIVGKDKEIIFSIIRKPTDGSGLGIGIVGIVNPIENYADLNEVPKFDPSAGRYKSIIHSIKPNGPVDKEGSLHMGDELLQVNQYSLLNLPHEEVIAIIKSIHSDVCFVACSNQLNLLNKSNINNTKPNDWYNSNEIDIQANDLNKSNEIGIQANDLNKSNEMGIKKNNMINYNVQFGENLKKNLKINDFKDSNVNNFDNRGINPRVKNYEQELDNAVLQNISIINSSYNNITKSKIYLENYELELENGVSQNSGIINTSFNNITKPKNNLENCYVSGIALENIYKKTNDNKFTENHSSSNLDEKIDNLIVNHKILNFLQSDYSNQQDKNKFQKQDLIYEEVSQKTSGVKSSINSNVPVLVDRNTNSSVGITLNSSHFSEILERAKWKNEIKYVEIYKGKQGYGFSLLDYQDPSNENSQILLVRDLVPGGSAKQNGNIFPGDRIASVGNNNLLECSLKEAVNFLKNEQDGIVVIGLLERIVSQDQASFSANTDDDKITSEERDYEGDLDTTDGNLSSIVISPLTVPTPKATSYKSNYILANNDQQANNNQVKHTHINYTKNNPDFNQKIQNNNQYILNEKDLQPLTNNKQNQLNQDNNTNYLGSDLGAQEDKLKEQRSKQNIQQNNIQKNKNTSEFQLGNYEFNQSNQANNEFLQKYNQDSQNSEKIKMYSEEKQRQTNFNLMMDANARQNFSYGVNCKSMYKPDGISYYPNSNNEYLKLNNQNVKMDFENYKYAKSNIMLNFEKEDEEDIPPPCPPPPPPLELEEMLNANNLAKPIPTSSRTDPNHGPDNNPGTAKFHQLTDELLQKYCHLGGELRMVELVRPYSSNLGLSLAGSKSSSRLSTVVTKVHPGSTASINGVIMPGDELLEINDQILYERCHLNSAVIIKSLECPNLKIVYLRPANSKYADKIQDRGRVSLPNIHSSNSHKYDEQENISVRKNSDASVSSTTAYSNYLDPRQLHGKHSSSTPDLDQPYALSITGERQNNESSNVSINSLSVTTHAENATTTYDEFTIHIPDISNNVVKSNIIQNLLSTPSNNCDSLLDNPLNKSTASSSMYNLSTSHINGSLNISNVDNCLQNKNNTSQISLNQNQHSPSSSSNKCLLELPSTAHEQRKMSISSNSDENELKKEKVIELFKDNQEFGLNLIGGKDSILNSIIIKEIHPDGLVAKDGKLRVGDMITKINEHNFTNCTLEEAVKILKSVSPGKVKFSVIEEQAIIPSDISRTITFELAKKRGQGLGLTISDTPNGVFITELKKGGIAELDGRLVIGDQLIAVSQVNIADYNEAVELLKTSGSKCTITIKRLKPNKPNNTGDKMAKKFFGSEDTKEKPNGKNEIKNTLDYSQERSFDILNKEDNFQLENSIKIVTLHRGMNGYGFSVVGGYGSSHGNLPIYIKNVFEGGEAFRSGRLNRGDILMAVNGESLEGLSHQEAVDLLKRSQGTIVLKVHY